MVRILLLFVVGLPAVLILLFGESFFTEVRDEALWRTRPAPLDYLCRSGGAHAPEAEREVEIQQRALGLIARLRAGRYTARAYQTTWCGDDSQLLTIDGSVVQRWNSQSGAHLNTYEAPSRAGATNRERLANGFGLATFIEPNNRIAAITGREP